MYNPNIPQPLDWRPISQGQINTNFTVLNDVFGADHGAFDDVTSTSRGKHAVVEFVPRTVSSPVTVPITGESEGAVYVVNVQQDDEDCDIMFYKSENDATPIPLFGCGNAVVGGGGGGGTIGAIPGSAAAMWDENFNLIYAYNVSAISTSNVFNAPYYVTLTFETPQLSEYYYPFLGSTTDVAAGAAAILVATNQTLEQVTLFFAYGASAFVPPKRGCCIIYGPILNQS